jgi:hypothetical protein
MSEEQGMIKAYLLHLGYNMWADREVEDRQYLAAKSYLRCDKSLWNDVLARMAEIGMNMVVIDLGEGIQYQSHPELAVEGSWTPAQLQAELGRMRDMGLEPIPKLNFSACHDIWLGTYSRMLSTDVYYDVCQDLIAEVIDLFDTPRFFHLGMDEETARHQRHFEYVVIRQYDLWWNDLYFLVDQVEAGGVRPWIWSDYIWDHREVFLAKMPKSVLQSNWYYGAEFGEDVAYSKAYLDLEAHGYDQVPTGSNWSTPVNFGRTVEFAQENISSEHLLGFLQTVWRPTVEACRDDHMEALDLVRDAFPD